MRASTSAALAAARFLRQRCNSSPRSWRTTSTLPGSEASPTVEGVMNRRNRLRRAALVLALLVLAAIVTGVAASATTTAIPEKLTGKWERNHGMRMVVSPRGAVEIDPVFAMDVHAELSHV